MPASSSRKRKFTPNSDKNDDDLDGFTRKGTIYVGHLPHGFYEEALSGFFGQFGKVTRVKVARNRYTLRPRGYAYVEFKYEAIARVAAETMNNYIMFKKALQCKLLPAESVSDRLQEDDYKLTARHKRPVALHNRRKSSETTDKNGRKLIQRYLAKKAKLAELGIEYECQDYEVVLAADPDLKQSLQGTSNNTPIASPKTKNTTTKRKKKRTLKDIRRQRRLMSKYVRPPKFIV